MTETDLPKGFTEWSEEAHRFLRSAFPHAPTGAMAIWDGARWQWLITSRGRRWMFKGFLIDVAGDDKQA